MLQASVCDGCSLDAFALGEDCLGLAEVDVGRSQIVDALMIADVVVVFDEGVNLPFKVAGQVIVLEQNAVLQGLMPAFDLSLSLGMIRRPAHVLHALGLEPFGQIGRHVR
jgi:hypothetical protein